MQAALAEHEPLLGGFIRWKHLQANFTAQVQRSRNLVEEAVDAPLADVAFRCSLGDDLAATAFAGLENHHLGLRTPGQNRLGRGQSRNSRAHNADFHIQLPLVL